jgi:hypothetical protein
MMTKNIKKTKEQSGSDQRKTKNDRKSYCGCGCVPFEDDK